MYICNNSKQIQNPEIEILRNPKIITCMYVYSTSRACKYLDQGPRTKDQEPHIIAKHIIVELISADYIEQHKYLRCHIYCKAIEFNH